MTQASSFLEIDGVSKVFDSEVAVRDFSVTVAAGEFVSLLGPSGCGKTTLLRMVAGLEAPDTGRILLDGKDLTNVPAHKRPVNMVFQRITLFPHLDVFENIAFGLRLARLPKAEIAERVKSALDLVRLPGFDHRAVSTLSGGQAQRIALARALAVRPKVLLFDEPLSALDLQIRREMQGELKSIHKSLGGTFLYVTHDQEEAMSMSNRVIVMNNGRIEQVADPVDLYRVPASRFVAAFLGSSNLWPGRLKASTPEHSVVEISGRELWAAPSSVPDSGQVWLLLREESISVEASAGGEPPGPTSLPGTVTDVSFVGPVVHYAISTPERTVKVARSSHGTQVLAEGAPVLLSWRPADLLVLASDDPTGTVADISPETPANGEAS